MRVLVVCLPNGPTIPGIAAEILAGARELPASGPGAVAAALVGHGLEAAAAEAGALGAETVYAVDAPALADFDADLYLQALEAVVREAQPEAILMPADELGAELAPRLAYRLGTGAVTEAVAMRVAEDGQLLFSRPIYGGRLVAEMAATGAPAVATFTPGSFEARPRDASRAVEVRRVAVQLQAGERRVKTLEVQREDTGGVPLEGARVVVSGGRGLAEGGNFKYVEELARVLGAAVGASRAAVDEGWVAPGLQVGQTGKKVAPDIYIAVAISGATQHIAGMSRAKHVVVINTDAESPFYKIAEVGVAADFKKLLPLLTARLKELTGA